MRIIRFSFPISEISEGVDLKQLTADKLDVPKQRIRIIKILKKSIDSRQRTIRIVWEVQVFLDEEKDLTQSYSPVFRSVNPDNPVIIIGAGPSGLFAALRFLEAGVKPIIFERGKDVRNRRRDLALINREGIINPDSNYCFGEGGAGTYSDGKLFTRSTKRGDVKRVLNLLIHFGADPSILYEPHPHIGTNKLPVIVKKIREQIIGSGGEIHFETKVTDLILKSGEFQGVVSENNEIFRAKQVMLCTGHSARDIYFILQQKGVYLKAKPFAIGVRVEHPQLFIDEIRYHNMKRGPWLPPASYQMVTQVNGRGVFSFCMCPGGIIAPASTEVEALVLNGWSPSKRNNEFGNSGIVVTVDERDWKHFEAQGALAGMHFQKSIEEAAWFSGGGKLVAPGQRISDFVSGAISSSLPRCSYLPGVLSADIPALFPPLIQTSLVEAFRAFESKMKGFITSEGIVLAPESRTSAPVRIPRDLKTRQHPQIRGLFPCGEGAGYAGGIVSAAIDGQKSAESCLSFIGVPTPL